MKVALALLLVVLAGSVSGAAVADVAAHLKLTRQTDAKIARSEPPPHPEPEPPAKVRSQPPRAGTKTPTATPAFGRTRTLGNGQFEYLAAGTPSAVDRAEDLVRQAQGRILRREELRGLGLSLIALDLAGRISSAEMQRRIAAAGLRVALDRNTIFSPSAGRAYAQEMIGATATGACALARPVRIGLIDGPVDTAQRGLSNVPLVARSVLDDGDSPADTDHATGLVSLIAMPQGMSDVSGLAVGADIFSAVAFARDDAGNGMRLDHFARGLDWLVAERVDIVNMSIAGPENRVLARLLSSADAGGAVLVAAVGNEGRGVVAYPAADPNVIAITAVDARQRLYGAANTGSETAFAAPGVDLLVASGSGSGYRSGTSYATAIASAVIAHEIGRGAKGRQGVISALRRDARDLGQPGRDSRFGWGLMQLSGCQ